MPSFFFSPLPTASLLSSPSISLTPLLSISLSPSLSSLPYYFYLSVSSVASFPPSLHPSLLLMQPANVMLVKRTQRVSLYQPNELGARERERGHTHMLTYACKRTHTHTRTHMISMTSWQTCAPDTFPEKNSVKRSYTSSLSRAPVSNCGLRAAFPQLPTSLDVWLLIKVDSVFFQPLATILLLRDHHLQPNLKEKESNVTASA